MTGWTGLGTGVKALVLGGGAAVAAVVAAVVWQGPTVQEPQLPEASAPIAAAPAVKPAAEAVQPAPTAGPSETVPAPPVPPTFDVVRVEPDGATLVAGRALAGQEVAVLVDGAETALAVADPQGRFVVFLTLASSASARIMTLELRPEGSAVIPSEDQVLLAPSGAVAPAPEGVTEAPAATPLARPQAEAVARAAPEIAEPPPAPAPEVAAPVVEEPAPVVAAAAVAEPEAEPNVVAAEPVPAAEPDVVVAEPVPAAAPDAAPAAAATVVAAPAAPEPPVVSEAKAVAEAAAGVTRTVDPAAAGAPEQAAVEPVAAAAEPVPEPAPPASEAAAPTALLLSGNTVKVLQSSGAEPASPSGSVSIDTISYTESGEVALSGRGAAQAFVRLYLDNRVLLETAIAEDGTWGGTLPAVAPGVYALRADQLSAAGQVTSRYETPFQREDPLALAQPVLTGAERSGGARLEGRVVPGPGRVSITVQPGFTLWQIARENYGDGTLYVRVYDANKTLIRDPDLIYPGQVFSVPTGN